MCAHAKHSCGVQFMFLRLCIACRVIRRRAFKKKKGKYRRERVPFCLYRKDYRHLMAQTERAK